MRDCILIINRGAVNCRLRNDFKRRGLKMGVFVGGGGGGLTWTLILRIFGMVSITFFFAPPPSKVGIKLLIATIALTCMQRITPSRIGRM